MMNSGMSMMLKSFGLDPEELLRTAESVGEGIKNINGALARIEANQADIIARLDRLDGGNSEPASNVVPLLTANKDN